MNCKKCGREIVSSLPAPIPHWEKYDCGCYAFDNEAEWEASTACKERQREKEWYEKGGTWESYKVHYNINSR